jgi:hypothetical protein
LLPHSVHRTCIGRSDLTPEAARPRDYYLRRLGFILLVVFATGLAFREGSFPWLGVVVFLVIFAALVVARRRMLRRP